MQPIVKTLKEQCDLFIEISDYDQKNVENLYDDNNLLFTGNAQKPAYDYLSKVESLDDFTQFDSYRFEQSKTSQNPSRIYTPNTLVL